MRSSVHDLMCGGSWALVKITESRLELGNNALHRT